MTTNSDFERMRAARASEVPSSTTQRVVDKADEVHDRVSDKAAELQDRVAEQGQQTSERIDAAMTSAGEHLNTLAQTVRRNAPAGQVGDLANNAARALENSGVYLEGADLQKVRHDTEQVIRDHPIEALAISMGIGFLIGKSRRSSRRNYN